MERRLLAAMCCCLVARLVTAHREHKVSEPLCARKSAHREQPTLWYILQLVRFVYILSPA